MDARTLNDRLDQLSQRAGAYRLFARLLFSPLSQEDLDALARVLPATEGQPGALNDVARALRLRHSGTREELAADFTGAFYGAVSCEGRYAMPYESLFRGERGLLMGEARGEVYHALKAACVRVHEGLDLPEDHLSFICELMALLCDREAEALCAGDEAAAAQAASEQARLFEEHVENWYGDFCALAQRIVQTRFYRAVLRVGEELVAQEHQVLLAA